MTKESEVLPKTQAIILAGGKGERLAPLTELRPKPSVAFGGIFRIIDFTLSNCLHSRFDRVSILTQYRYEELHSYLRKGWSELWNSLPGKKPLHFLSPTSGKRYRGTADAVFHNLPVIESDNSAELVLILSGDHIYHMDYREMIRRHVETNADLTIATVEHPLEEASHFGVIQVNGTFQVTGFQEKPRFPQPLPSKADTALVSMGVYLFKAGLLSKVLPYHCDSGLGYDFGHDVIPALIESGRVFAYDFRNKKRDEPRYWRDIGTLDSYYKASMDLIGETPVFDPYLNETNPSQPTRHPMPEAERKQLLTRVHAGAKLERSILSVGVRIAQGAEVEHSVLMPGVSIGQGARIRRAIIEEGVQIPEGLQIGFDAEYDRKHFTITESGIVVVGKTPVWPREETIPEYSAASLIA